MNAVLAEDGLRLRNSGRIAHRGPRANHIQIVADHVGQNQGDQRGRIRRSGQLPAFDEAEMLADRVQLVNRRTRVEQPARDLLLGGQRQRRRRSRQQCRGAA